MNYRLPFRNKASSPQRLFHALGSKLVMFFLCYLIAAVSFGGFFEKWAFRDGMSYSAIEMLDGVAKRPFVYRQLLPATANLVDKIVPERINKEFSDWLTVDPSKRNFIYRYFSNAKDSTNPAYVLRYYVLFVLCFASYLLGILAIRAVCYEVYPDATAATLAAFLMGIIFPMLTTEGGYMYDMAELLFMALAVLLAIRGRILLLMGIAALATFNKESFFFFILTLYPFFREKFSTRKTLAIEAALLAETLVINLLVKFYYADNPGVFAVDQFSKHMEWLLNPASYFLFEVNYGAVTTKGLNIVHLIILAFIVRNAWAYVPSALRRHGWIALAINFPLFIAFCYRGELRNLSMLFVTFAVLLCISISRHFQRLYQGSAFAPQKAFADAREPPHSALEDAEAEKIPGLP